MDKSPTTVSSFKIILISLLIVTSVILTVILVILILDRPATLQSFVQYQKMTYSYEEMQRYLNFKEFLNVSSDFPPSQSSPSSSNMKLYMRSIYQDMTDISSKTRYDSNDILVALPNHQLIDSSSSSSSSPSTYNFNYQGSLQQSLIDIHLILPLTSLPTLRLISSMFDVTLSSPCRIDQTWCEINLTQYITSFPVTFRLESSTVDIISSGFLLLHFRRPPLSLSSNIDETSLVAYPQDLQQCQVRPFRISFTKLRWSNWIIEPSSYSMNLCSGSCQTGSNMATYTIIQNLLHQKYPKQISAPCCRPKRFASMNFLYYEGENLLLKKHSNMRVMECGCSL